MAQEHLFSSPVSCQITQSVASKKQSAASYISGDSSRICQSFGKVHSDDIFPPYLKSHFLAFCCDIRKFCSLILCRVMFPQLHIGVGLALEFIQKTKRRAIFFDRSTVQDVKSTPTPMTSSAETPLLLKTSGIVFSNTSR